MPKALKPEQGYDQSSMPKWFSRWVGQALRRWRMRRAVAELERLDDDVLRDIGITRAQIPSLALRMTAPPATATTSIAAQSG